MRWLPAALGFLFSAVGPALAAETTADPIAAETPAELTREERIQVLIEQTGIANWIREAPALAAGHVLNALGKHTGGGSQNLADTFAGHFAPEPILQRVAEALLERYDAKAVEALDHWYRSRTGSEIAASAASAASPAGRAQLADYIRRLRTDPPSTRRRRLGRRIAEATGLPERRTSISVAMNFTVTQVLYRLMRASRIDDGDVQQRLLANIERRLSGSIRTQSVSHVLFATRMLPTEQLVEYLHFVERDAAQWIWRISDQEYQRSVRASLEVFARDFSEFLEQRDTPLHREAQREEGERFGARTRDRECVREAFRRDHRCKDLVCEIGTADFLGACLDTSRPTESFCAESATGSDSKAQSLWRARACLDRDRKDRICLVLVAEVQDHCQSLKEASSLTRGR